ncbi:hypothetical protein [Bradyrhizobium sp. NBAIM01]|uniref:hypothetical protein n=1 Tax=Bradyrhizobium sp. NBAIM01 TaxID=2793818 RepID=UPI001CD80102|nr:hypothetical protein [Bradyrhizobium sp. NBAIM01]MCA1512671.1 hypothetical protein [Bradyrhizobium sp. NBAIM01]
MPPPRRRSVDREHAQQGRCLARSHQGSARFTCTHQLGGIAEERNGLFYLQGSFTEPSDAGAQLSRARPALPS